MNSTYKSTLKGLKTLEFGLKAGLLSSAKWSKQRACRGRRGGGAAWSAQHQNKRQCIIAAKKRNQKGTVKK